MNSQFIIIVYKWNKVIYIMTGMKNMRRMKHLFIGRNGKGTIVVTAAGNYGDKKDSVTLDTSKNNRYYVNVGATGYFKTVAAYSKQVPL